MKYGNWTFGEFEALINKLGEEKARAILRGEKRLTLEDVIQLLFDRHGRRIPPSGLVSAVCDANKDFYLSQPKLDLELYGKALARLQTHLKPGPFISVAEFEGRSQKLLRDLQDDSRLANLAKGVHLPFCLPQTEVKDYGEELEKFLNAFKEAYTAEFPNRSFITHRQGEIKRQVKVVKGARHEEFLAKLAQGTVVGLYFPTVLHGYSIPASREQMATLPKEFILAGGLDIVANLVMYPDVLARDWHTPGLDCAALSWSSADCSLCFKADGDHADFDSGDLDALGDYSSGVVLLG